MAVRRRQARNAVQRARKVLARPLAARATPHLGLVRAPISPTEWGPMRKRILVATYNVHRWTGLNGRSRPDPARAGYVISELDADVIAFDGSPLDDLSMWGDGERVTHVWKDAELVKQPSN